MTDPLVPPTPASLMKCPFILCQARPEVTMHQPDSRYPEVWHQIVLMHVLDNDKVPGKHACPASMTKYPTPPVTLAAFARDIMHFVAMMGKNEADAMVREILDDSESAHGPAGGRPGRDPDPEDPAWQRGGRADEDIPETPQAGIEERRPMGIIGGIYNHTEGVSTVASNAEMVSGLQAIILKINETVAVTNAAVDEARNRMHQIQQEYDSAVAILHGLNQGAESQRLNDAVANLATAVTSVESGFAQLDEGCRSSIRMAGHAEFKVNEQISAILG